MYTDRIDLTLPEEDVASLLAIFLFAEEQLRVLPAVNPSDRKRYAKLGLKNEGLAMQIIEVGRQNPEEIPRGINFEQIDRDIAARHQLRLLKLVLERLLGKVQDAMQLTGVDIYAAALSIYHCLRRHGGTGGLREAVEELKRGFARPSRKKKEETVVDPIPAVPSAQPTPSQPITSGASTPGEVPNPAQSIQPRAATEATSQPAVKGCASVSEAGRVPVTFSTLAHGDRVHPFYVLPVFSGSTQEEASGRISGLPDHSGSARVTRRVMMRKI